VEMITYAPGTPIWIDVSTPDMEATKAFYGALFGWEGTTYPEMGGYTNFTLRGKLVAGGAPIMAPDQRPAWTTYIATADADATTKAVQENDGQVIVPPMDVADLGRMAAFIDPTGAFFGIWQPGKHLGAELVNEPGTFIWNELDTRDIEAAKAFYTRAFPWTAQTNGEGAQAYTEWKVDGRSIAGAMQMGDQFPAEVPPNWLTYFAVADCDATAAKVQELGGIVRMPGMDIDMGRFAVLSDPNGATFAVMQGK
jgi:predicted enzyme related to lactoylglutathione lyase